MASLIVTKFRKWEKQSYKINKINKLRLYNDDDKIITFGDEYNENYFYRIRIENFQVKEKIKNFSSK